MVFYLEGKGKPLNFGRPDPEKLFVVKEPRFKGGLIVRRKLALL